MRTPEEIRAYYNEFAAGYEDQRSPNLKNGYHAMLDDLEVDLVKRYGTGLDVLEAGCGTGLLLARIAEFAHHAEGVDLSPGMLRKAEERGLNVREGSVTALPYNDGSFDLTCSFKVLAHVPDIGLALAEMARVTRPGGVMIAEFYNPLSIRGILKQYGPAGRISSTTKESAVYTRFDAPWNLPKILPPGTRVESLRGIRIVTPAASAFKIPGLGRALRKAETLLADTKAAYAAGFVAAVIRKSNDA
jgi:ubiquinone/menaquinone biosynthesis C-methylase UbiE